MKLHRLLLFALLLTASFAVIAQPVKWTLVAPGVWKAVIGKPEAYNLLTASGAKPNTSGLAKLGSANFPFSQNDIAGTVRDGKTSLRFPLDREEQLYGFGLNFQTVHQRGKILQLHVDHYGGRDNGRTHAPTPFYVSSKGYGVFVNAARYINVYAGSGVRKDSKNAPVERDRNTEGKLWQARPYSDAVEMLVPAGGVEVYVFAGPTAMDAVKRFNLFNGGGPIPPRWGLGFTQRVKSLYTAEEVTKESNGRVFCGSFLATSCSHPKVSKDHSLVLVIMILIFSRKEYIRSKGAKGFLGGFAFLELVEVMSSILPLLWNASTSVGWQTRLHYP